MRPAIALVAGLGGICAYRAILTVADGPDFVRRHPQLHQKIFSGGGAAVAQAQVVFGRAALIAMPLEHYVKRRVSGEYTFQSVGIAGQNLARIIPDVALVVIE